MFRAKECKDETVVGNFMEFFGFYEIVSFGSFSVRNSSTWKSYESYALNFN